MSARYRLQGGPLDGVLVIMPAEAEHVPAALRLLRDAPAPAHVAVHVYAVNRGHQAAPGRAEQPAYLYSHTVTI